MSVYLATTAAGLGAAAVFAQDATPAAPTQSAPPPADRVAPQAAEAMEREEEAQAAPTTQAERPKAAAPKRAEAAPAPAAVAPVAAPITDSAPSDAGAPPVTEAYIAPPDALPVLPPEEPEMVEEPVVTNAIDEQWLIAAGLLGALGLAGAGVVLASRRRKRPVAEAAAKMPIAKTPVGPANDPLTAPPQIATARQPLKAQSIPFRQTVFSSRPAAPVSSDPLFAHRASAEPVTDPLFHRTAGTPPPVTDPMFAGHPDYAGPDSQAGSQIGQNRMHNRTDAERTDGNPGERIRTMEPAE